MAGVAAVQGPAARQHGAEHEPAEFAARVQVRLARAGPQRMTMEDDDSAAGFAGELLESLAQIEFFAREEFLVESAHLLERRGLAEDERPCQQMPDAAEHVPEARDPGNEWVLSHFEFDCAAPGQALAGLHLDRH